MGIFRYIGRTIAIVIVVIGQIGCVENKAKFDESVSTSVRAYQYAYEFEDAYKVLLSSTDTVEVVWGGEVVWNPKMIGTQLKFDAEPKANLHVACTANVGYSPVNSKIERYATLTRLDDDGGGSQEMRVYRYKVVFAKKEVVWPVAEELGGGGTGVAKFELIIKADGSASYKWISGAYLAKGNKTKTNTPADYVHDRPQPIPVDNSIRNGKDTKTADGKEK